MFSIINNSYYLIHYKTWWCTLRSTSKPDINYERLDYYLLNENYQGPFVNSIDGARIKFQLMHLWNSARSFHFICRVTAFASQASHGHMRPPVSCLKASSARIAMKASSANIAMSWTMKHYYFQLLLKNKKYRLRSSLSKQIWTIQIEI